MANHPFAWGTLPIENYLLRSWGQSLDEDPTQQRSRLIQRYLESDELRTHVRDGEPAPTTVEIDAILRPWRPCDLRRKARSIFTEEMPILLRTRYKLGDEKRIQDRVAKSLTFKREAWWALFDDKDLFNFGSDWRRIYEIMPEVAGPMSRQNRRSPDERELKYFRMTFKRYLQTQKKLTPDMWRENSYHFIEDLALHLQRVVTATYILIADQEAFESGCLRLLYLDGQRNIVREARVDAEHVGIFEIIMHWDQTTELWEESRVGEKYKVEGDLGKELYDLNEQDLADP